MNPNFIGVYPNAVPSELCQSIIAKIDQLEECNPSALVAGQHQYDGKLLRKDFSIPLELHSGEMTKELNFYLNECLVQYADTYPEIHLLNSGINSTCSKIQKTPAGGGFNNWHCEASSSRSSNRQLVWMVYLNTLSVEQGGETEFKSQQLRLRPEEGTVVLFPSFWTHGHKGNPPYNTTKYIATGWYDLEIV